MELLTLYVWLSLHSILVGLAVLLVISILYMVVILLILASMNDTEVEESEKKPWMKWWKRMPAMAISFFALLILIPNPQQIAVLVAGHYALKMSETPEAGKVMALLRKKANEYLDEATK